jgi:non-specific protein-tyrosine kinase
MSWPFGRRGSLADEVPDDDDVVVLLDPSLDSRLVVYHEPRSHPAEQFRTFRTNLCAMNPEGSPRSLLFTSASPDEGKSTTVANVALSLAEFETLRVCLLDFDLRAPRMHELFGLPRGPGLTDVLLDRKDPRRVLQPAGVPNLRVISAGRETTRPNDVGSDYIQELLGFLKSSFDFVILDTPPCGLFADASHLAKLIDGVILVVALGETGKVQADGALEALDAAGGNVIGSFVTGTSVGEPTVVADGMP